MCLKRCPACAGWIDKETDACVECGQAFPSFPAEDDEPVTVERLTLINTAGLIRPEPEPPKARPVNRQIILGPDLMAVFGKAVFE
jgi:hypothetical protein